MKWMKASISAIYNPAVLMFGVSYMDVSPFSLNIHFRSRKLISG